MQVFSTNFLSIAINILQLWIFGVSLQKRKTVDKLKREIPEYMIMPYGIPESSLPTILDFGPNGYADGKDKRRARREQERKNKKK